MSKTPAKDRDNEVTAGRYAYEGLEPLLHARARLSIMTSLMTQTQGLLFNDLKKGCSLTDGNLNRHLDVLFKAGFIEVWKKQVANRSQTLFRVTPLGRQEYLAYLQELERLVKDALPAKASAAPRGNLAGWRMGWV